MIYIYNGEHLVSDGFISIKTRDLMAEIDSLFEKIPREEIDNLYELEEWSQIVSIAKKIVDIVK